MTTATTQTSREPASPAPLTAPIRVAVIGGGKISEEHLRPLTARPDVNVLGVCDLSAALATFTSERFGRDRWWTDHRAMLEQARPDIVHVLTPPATHAPIVRDCLAAGAHVLVEKPIALSNADFRALWDAARARGLHLIENHNYRFNAPVLRLQRLVEQGRLGRVEEVEVRLVLNIRGGGRYADENLPHPSHRLPAGVIHEFISHLSYLTLLFLPEPDRLDLVRAAWSNAGGGDLFKYDDLDALVTSGPIHARIRFSARQFPDRFTIRVRGSDGHAQAELFQPAFTAASRRAVGQHLTPMVNSLAGARMLTAAGFGNVWRKVRNRTAYEGLDRYINATYDALRAGLRPPVGLDEMDRTSRLIDALLAPENRL